MKIGNKISAKVFLLFSCLLILIIISLSYFNNVINNNLDTLTIESLDRLAAQQQSAFNNELAEKQQDIQNVAQTLALLWDNQGDTINYLNSVADSFGYESIVLLDADGNGILTGSKYYAPVEDIESFNIALGGQAVTSAPFLSNTTDQTMVGIYMPVYRNFEVAGVVIALYSADYLTGLLNNAVYDGGWAIVVDNELNVLLSTDPSIPAKLPIDKAVFEGEDSHDSVLADIANKSSNSVIFHLNNERRFSIYRPLNYNDWTIFYVMPAIMVTKNADEISSLMFLISTIILVAFIGIVIFIITSEQRNIKKIEHAAYYDPVTGLSNLAKFRLDLAKVLANNKDKRYYILKGDIANFKVVNEIYDHEVGNRVLQTIANVGREMPADSFFQARTGADEFMMIGEEFLFSDMDNATTSYEKRFRELLDVAQNHQFRFRLGRAIINPNESDVDAIISRAEIAHSMAKEDKTSHWYDYDDRFKSRIITITEITNRMESALADGEFKVFLQPKNNVANGKVIGAEALVRWIRPDNSMVYPDSFIPIFENNGFITEVDLHMLRSVCNIIKEWIDKGKKFVPISVNFSRINIKNPLFVNNIKNIIESYNVPIGCIEIELTETITQENPEDVDRLFTELKNAKLTVAIDDFGSGYSSLGMLRNIKADILKLDRSFFIKSASPKRTNILINGVVTLAHELDMFVVAEGVEDAEQLEYLKCIGCDVAQGYYFAKPMPVKEFEDLYLSRRVTNV